VRARTLIALALVGALVGCQESGFDESKETQRPLKVQHALDPLTGTKVPGQAERPLALSPDALGDTLALGVTPVAAADELPYASETRDIPRIRDDDMDAIAARTPDLILGSKESEGSEYKDLSRIAPTVMTEGEDWKLNLRLHGEALGRTNDAEELLIDWDNRVARVKRRLGGGSVSVVLTPGASVGEFSLEPGSIAGSVLGDLGMRQGTGGDRVLRITAGPQWVNGGVLAARAALQDVADAL
jgi:iron complex transport system substrate-binding protein